MGEVVLDSGMQALCQSLGNACHKHDMGTNEGLFVVFLCLAAGYFGGCSIVKTIRGWVRNKPGNTIFHAFYLLALPMSLSIGMQAAAVAWYSWSRCARKLIAWSLSPEP